MNDYLIEIFARVLMILLILPLHELAHGFIAHKMGDDTAELSGRITLNPLAHVDLVGSLLLVLTGFGWAKPVPVNPHRMKSPRKGMALTALAGPVSNLLAALLIRIICEVAFCFKGVYYSDNMTVSTVLMLLVFMYQINIHLAVFNLIPVPPLDGYNIISYFTSYKVDKWFRENGHIISTVFFIFIIFMNRIPSAFNPILIVSNLISNVIGFVVGWIPDLIGGYGVI